MKSEDTIDVIALENPALAYRLSATCGLLRWLKHKEHVAPELAGALAQNAIDIHGGRKGHCHMGVVAAGMHLARMSRSKARARRLFNR